MRALSDPPIPNPKSQIQPCSPFFNMAQNLTLRCVLISDPSTLGAKTKNKTRLESRIKKLTPIAFAGRTYSTEANAPACKPAMMCDGEVNSVDNATAFTLHGVTHNNNTFYQLVYAVPQYYIYIYMPPPPFLSKWCKIWI